MKLVLAKASCPDYAYTDLAVEPGPGKAPTWRLCAGRSAAVAAVVGGRRRRACRHRRRRSAVDACAAACAYL